MVCEKIKAKILRFYELFLSCLLALLKSEKIIKKTAVPRISLHKLVNNNKESIIESEIMKLS